VEEIGNSLPAVFKRQLRKPGTQLAEILAPLWARAAGRAIAEHSRPAAFADGTLTLEADSHTWAAQLRLMREQIRKKVNAFLGVPVVKELEVSVSRRAAAERNPEVNYAREKGRVPARAMNSNIPQHRRRLD
jgi:predicted nucleic acid-binding Zn ribbon protein